MKPWIQRRVEKGVYNNILNELRVGDAESYRRFLRTNTETFEVSSFILFLVNMIWGISPVLFLKYEGSVIINGGGGRGVAGGGGGILRRLGHENIIVKKGATKKKEKSKVLCPTPHPPPS